MEDGKWDQDAFTEEQKRVYDTLSRAHTSLITGKTAELEREENMDYNSRAVSFFADAFSKFKKDENRYTKNEDALKSLADTYLFAFDANRLQMCIRDSLRIKFSRSSEKIQTRCCLEQAHIGKVSALKGKACPMW